MPAMPSVCVPIALTVGTPNLVTTITPNGGDITRMDIIMTESTTTTSTIATWAAQGRTFTDARNAGIAHLLATGVKASVIVNESGVDKGDVSRISKAVKAMPAAQIKTLKSLRFPSASDVLKPEAIRPWAKFGENNLRRNAAGVGAKRAVKSDEEKLRDALAVAFDLIVANPENEAAWLSLITDLFTPEQVAEQRAGSVEEEQAA